MSRCRGVSGLLDPTGGFQVILRLCHGVREVGVVLELKNSMVELLPAAECSVPSLEGSGS